MIRFLLTCAVLSATVTVGLIQADFIIKERFVRSDRPLFSTCSESFGKDALNKLPIPVYMV